VNPKRVVSGMRALGRIVNLTFLALAFAVVIASVALGVALSTRTSGKWVRYVTTVSAPATFKLTRNFVDYMMVGENVLYGAYLNHGLVVVVNLPTDQVTATIPVKGNVHGVAVDTDHSLGFVSNGSDNSIAVFDLNTSRILKNIPLSSEGPDAILYDRKVGLVYVANQKSASGALIDPVTLSVVATIPLGGGGPEFCKADTNTGLIYQNLEETDEVVVIDPFKRSVVFRFQLPTGHSPTGLALDTANHRLFVTGMHKKLAVLNAENGAIVATLPIGSLSDGVDYDPGLRRAYTANGLGSMTVIQQDDPDHYSVMENAKTRFGGHSVTVDPATHRIYVASFGSILVYDATLNAAQWTNAPGTLPDGLAASTCDGCMSLRFSLVSNRSIEMVDTLH
jgi:YVTN family beta-propeller protein